MPPHLKYLVGGVSSTLIFSRRHSTSDDRIGGLITIVFVQDSNDSTQWQRQEAQQNICKITIGLHIKNLSLLLVYNGFQEHNNIANRVTDNCNKKHMRLDNKASRAPSTKSTTGEVTINTVCFAV
ncbi:acyl-CoA N-acyltransferases super family protein [Striga asiatica]|uniref:Acyl-CoA N-acyltransferases super family protein n=1 Tax=Striga asiatica TaxID=4170 RepID=A0A5A7QDV6_STRAF|nr:acyl-CoA N-acyltransferases super family protein [Striga asiatica]